MFKQLLRGVLLLACLSPFCQGRDLALALMYGNPQQRDNFVAVLRGFYAETGIRVQLLAYTDQEYKAKFPLWLTAEHSPDLLYWQGGERLLAYARRGALRPLDELWQAQNWQASFGKAMQRALSWRGHTYALPYSYYHWGIFYSKRTLQRVGLTPPTTWSQLLHSCTRLRQQGITPLVLGSKDQWPVLAWFDYLNLRLNGLAFHQQVTRGQVDYRDPRIRQVFNHWLQLIRARCFNDNIAQLDWNDSISYLYYGKGAMTLMGSLAIAERRSDDIQTLPFPRIRADMPRYEDAPLDLFVVPARANPHLADIQQLLAYLGQPEVQIALNQRLGTFSPHRQTQQQRSPLQAASQQLLQGAAGFAQYFDRDVPPDFDRTATPIMAHFATHPDIESTLTQLEILRQHYYPAAAPQPEPKLRLNSTRQP